MSLIQLSSTGSQNERLNNFNCYFNRGIIIPPNSKVGLISATLQNANVDTINITNQNNRFSLRFGLNPYVNNTIEIIIPQGEYTFKALAQYMELEVSKKQNYLPFKTLTHLNKSNLTESWLKFGTRITAGVGASGDLTSLIMAHYQTPSTNTGNVAISGTKIANNIYKNKPLLSNFVNYNIMLQAPREKYNTIEQDGNFTVITAEKLGKRKPQLPGGIVVKKCAVPVLLREYISFGQASYVFKIERPDSQDDKWDDTSSGKLLNNRLVGLVSAGDVYNGSGDAPGSILDDFMIMRNEYPGCKIGAYFEGATVSVIGSSKQETEQVGLMGDEQMEVMIKADGTEAQGALDDSVAAYYVLIDIDRGAAGIIQQGSARVRVSVNADGSAPLIDCDTRAILDLTSEGDAPYLGTAAYPLLPIITNFMTKAEADGKGCQANISVSNSNNFQYTNAKVLDSEIHSSYPTSIPFNPYKEFKINSEYTSDSIKYLNAATGVGDVQQLDFKNGLIAYLGPSNEIEVASNLNTLIDDYQAEYDALHPSEYSQNSTLGPVLGLNENVYTANTTVATDSEILGSKQWSKTGIITNRTAGNPSYHIQLSSLPVQSLNSVNHSITRTIAVIPKSSVGTQQTSIEASEVQYVSLNNKSEINITDIDVKITEADNTLTSDLTGMVELICMIKQ